MHVQTDPALALPAPSVLGRPERVLAADGLRGLAALAIVLHHSSFIAGTTFELDLAGAVYSRLDVGVPIFFALSGFLLFEPYVRRIVNDESFPPLWSFWRRRVVRIFPAYWVALFLQLAIGAIAVVDGLGLVLTTTLTHVYAGARAITGITQSWSLATEISFYFVLPLFAMLGARLCRGRAAHQQLLILGGLTGGWIVISTLSRGVVLATHPPHWINFRYTVFSNADFFAIGMLFAILMVGVRLGGPFAALHGTLFRHPWVWYAAGISAFMITATQLGTYRGLETGSGEVEMARQLGYFLTALGCVAPACCAGDRGPIQRFLGSAPLVWLGLVSYGVYLWHQVFISAPGEDGGLLLQWFGWELFDAPLWPLAGMATVGALILGAASWYLLEKPLLERFR